jgi:hypothetical protein
MKHSLQGQTLGAGRNGNMANVTFGPVGDLAFEREQNSSHAHDEDDDSGEAAGGQVHPEENFSDRHGGAVEED